VKAKVKKEAEKKRIAEEKKKKRTLEYIQQLWNEVLAEDATCCGNHLLQRQIITQAVNLLSWISSGKFTRELNKESLLN